VPIAEDDQKYLGFNWKGITYQYTCLPFGIVFAQRLFTNLLKPVYASLRNLMISFFSCGSETVIVLPELIMFQRKTISCVGTKIDLFLCTTKPYR
jgi:hypothetical protein